VLLSLGITDVYPLICSRHTDKTPAVADVKTLDEIRSLAAWFPHSL